MPDWLQNGFQRFGVAPPGNVDPRLGQSPPRGLDAESQQLLEEALPRGLPFGRERQNRSERAEWAGVEAIRALTYRPGDILLGKFDGSHLGYRDDKPMVTVASARSGKSSTVIIPTLLTYPGSVLVLDPKGELASATAQFRREVLAQDVYVLDPFRCSGETSASFNALAELDAASPHLIDDVDKITQALILREGKDAEADHWTESAQFLLRGLVLYALRLPKAEQHLGTVRELLTLTYAPLKAAAEAAARLAAKGPEAAIGEAEIAQRILFKAMAGAGDQFFGALTAAGQSFLRKYERERSGIMSTAETQTRFLDSPLLREVSRRSDLKLSALRDENITLYLCMSVGEMQSHFRWLRLIVRQALTALERRGPYPRERLPILFLMEEFAALGHMPIMEQAAAYFPGFGVKLWMVLQDLAQLKRHYRDSWATMLGNAGLVQFFASTDQVTNDYISARLGMTSFALKGRTVLDIEGEAAHKERLIYPQEIEKVFAAATGRQGLIIAGRAPVAALRLSHADVACMQLRERRNTRSN
jgi:type IV secretion system protein VirD4